MIKMFGWERKVINQVEGKRKAELEYYKKRQWVSQVGRNIKYSNLIFILFPRLLLIGIVL
jgi:hypothetical protein